VRATDGSNTRTTLTDGNGYYRLYIPASWGTVTLSHPLRPATGWNDGSTAQRVASWQDATGALSSGGRVALGSALGLAGSGLTRNFGVVRDSRFYPDQSGQTSSPGTHTFAHTYAPGTLGTVTLSTGSAPRYAYQVRLDADCDGVYGPGEDWQPLPYTFGVGPAWPREVDGSLKGCTIEVRALVPAGEPAGAVDILLLRAGLTWGNNAAVVEPDGVTDTLQVTGGEVRLTKRVRNVTQNGSFGGAAQGRPGEHLEYCIAYQNLGTAPVSAFTLSDPVPFFTDPLTAVLGLQQPGHPLDPRDHHPPPHGPNGRRRRGDPRGPGAGGGGHGESGRGGGGLLPGADPLGARQAHEGLGVRGKEGLVQEVPLLPTQGPGPEKGEGGLEGHPLLPEARKELQEVGLLLGG